MTQLTKEQIALKQHASEFADTYIKPHAATNDISEKYPWDNVKALAENGFTGMCIPEEYGGKAHDFLDAIIVIEEMAKACGVTGRITVEANMGALGAILKYGTENQKKIAADLVLSGDKPAICITEPGAGSAATEMTTRADKVGDQYILNGKKHWITGGGVSKLYLVFARVFENDIEQGIGGFIVVDDGSLDGLRIGKREPTMGLRSIPETEVFFEDLAIPADSLLQPPQGIRRGFGALMTAYNGQRVGAGTVALGIAQGAYELALDYTQTREQFGRAICEFQGLQWMIVDMKTSLDASRALLHNAACNLIDGFPDVTAAAQAKVFATESSIKVANDALQLFGAAGYSRNNALERMVRDVRMFTIGGGTAQILRTVAASQILKRKLPQTRDGYAKS